MMHANRFPGALRDADCATTRPGHVGLRPISCNGRTAAGVVRCGVARNGTKAGRGCSTMQSSVRLAVANAILDKIPQALKSMYYAENELRRALFKGVMQRS